MMKRKLAIALIATIAASMGVVSAVAGSPTAKQIIEKSNAAYATLSSYSDEGSTVLTEGSGLAASLRFTIKLARPNLYRVDWRRGSGPATQRGAVWSSGNGDFMTMSGLSKPATFSTNDQALTAAKGVSGGASGIIPGVFFHKNWGNGLKSMERKPDEKIGDDDCYVLTAAAVSGSRTVWISQQDFLIRKVEDDVKAAALKAALEEAAKSHPEIQMPRSLPADSKLVQLHENILVNPSLSAQDFEH
jgi:outer membrane lipoprotein-sorting protein